ncbi:hypothetical protein KHQ06_01555 [Nocardia tengchongensis]|uniref:Uncharacterized protein n=1 Tax=Nocardia tengchongensis TaxID=2055889 RepID=A0ABX8CPL1_9NOCA|nr:hypothetical protein [Nocardia tengchongensis]QVI21876.1 hypothetical protein KHQ06_01555 [Nocardia tengchongensis]
MADHTVIGADVDPMFAHTVLSRELAYASGTSMVLADPVQPVLEQNQMVYGYSTAASTEAQNKMSGFELSGNFQPFGGVVVDPAATSFNVTVIQFPDQQHAQAAGEGMEAADFDVAPEQNAHITLDQTIDAKAHWRPGVPSLAATLSDGRYVISVFVQMPTADLNGLRSLADKIFAVQLPLLDRAPGLSNAEMFRLDYDPDAMLRRTLHPAPYLNLESDIEITHTARGYLHNVEAPEAWKPLLDANGVDRVSTAADGGLLFRARDANAALALWSGITTLTPNSAESPGTVPDTDCTRTTNPGNNFPGGGYSAWNHKDKYICTVRYHRYVAQVASDQLVDAQQKAAAQYALLANSQGF